MPDFDGINVELHSQYNIPRQNITKIIEYAPPSQLRRESLYSGTSPSSGYIPEFWEDATRTLNVCVPVLPGANFWVTYWIENPYAHFPDRQYKIQGVEREEEYYVMKLFVGTTHLATWCCDEKQNWNGKTHYGLYEDPDPDRAKELRLDILGRSNEHMGIPRAPIGKKVLQKRMLCFTAPPPALEGDATGSLRGEKKVERRWSRDSMNKLRKRSNKRLPNEVLERYIELRIYRANGMKRIPTEVEGFDVAKFGGHLGKGLEIAIGGVLQRGQPRRYFQFRLIDPKDQPYVTMRWFYRTYDELRNLGVDVDTPMPSESSSLTVTPNKKSGKMMIGMRGGSAAEEETEKNEKEDVNINGAGNNPRAPTSSPCDINDGSPFRKRLSIPPSNRLMPSQPAAFGYSPKKGARSWSLMRESTPELAIKQKGSVENMSRKLENMHLGSEEK